MQRSRSRITKADKEDIERINAVQAATDRGFFSNNANLDPPRHVSNSNENSITMYSAYYSYYDIVHKSILINILQEALSNRQLLSSQGPDVTLATNAFSVLTFNATSEASHSAHRADVPFGKNIFKSTR